MPLIDHVLVAVGDLGAAARDLRERHGLEAVEGGAHPGWGTANRIVPLGAAYLELIAVDDPAVAEGNPFGRWVAQSAERGGCTGWVVASDDLDHDARRLGLEVEEASRRRPDGTLLRWRMAGRESMRGDRRLPALIDWPDPERHPGRGASGGHAIAWLEVGGERTEIEHRVGSGELPLRYVEGVPGPRAVGVATPAGEVELRPAAPAR